MTSTGVKKTIFVCLLLILGGVWGYNLFQLIPRSDTTPFIIKKSGDTKLSNKGQNTHTMPKNPVSLISIEDPFLPFFKKQVTNQTPISHIAVIEAPPPAVLYLGLVSSKGRKNALVQIGGQITDIVESLDEVGGVKILSFDDETLKYKYKGKIYAVALGIEK